MFYSLNRNDRVSVDAGNMKWWTINHYFNGGERAIAEFIRHLRIRSFIFA